MPLKATEQELKRLVGKSVQMLSDFARNRFPTIAAGVFW